MFSFEISIPDSLRDKVIDTIVDTLVDNSKRIPGGSGIRNALKKARSDYGFRNRFTKSLQEGSQRFIRECGAGHNELVNIITQNNQILNDAAVQNSILDALKHPDRSMDLSPLRQQFQKFTSDRIAGEELDETIACFLRCITEFVWLMPEFSDIYNLIFQRITAEGTKEHLRLAQAQFRITEEVRDALIQIANSLGEGKQLPANDKINYIVDKQDLDKTIEQPLLEMISVESPFSKEDWGEAPEFSFLYGRDAEIAQLEKIIIEEKAKLIGVFGMGGIGKTSLVTSFAKKNAKEFDYIMWRSLRNYPTISELLIDVIRFLSNQAETGEGMAVREQVSKCVNYLRINHCLVVFDNIETTLGENVSDKSTKEWYGYLLQQLAENRHNSHIIVTSREKPAEISVGESATGSVRSINLSGVDENNGRQMLNGKGIFGSDTDWITLVSHYSGNPLALNIVSEMIREVYGGDISSFIEDGTPVFGRIQDVLAEQFDRLSNTEQDIILWLAIERIAVSRDTLLENLFPITSKKDILIALRSLRRRSLIELSEERYLLQNVI